MIVICDVCNSRLDAVSDTYYKGYYKPIGTLKNVDFRDADVKIICLKCLGINEQIGNEDHDHERSNNN